MSSARRAWLLTAVMISTLVSYLVAQSSVQEAETQDRPGNSSERGPSFPTSTEEEFAPDRILVKLKEGAPEAALDALNRQNNAGTDRRIPRTRIDVVRLPRELPVRAAVQRYEANPNVEYAEPDFIFRPSQMTANDMDFPKLYGLNNTGNNIGQTGATSDADIDAPEAWSTTTGAAGTLVAVIDEGVDISHPDLKNNIWTNPVETAGNGIDDDGNGYKDDVNGWDFANNDKTVYDSGDGDTHGTHVAGTIAAEGNNSLGVVGVNWRAKIMPLKFLGPNGGYTSDAVEALNYAVAKGAKISNNSWGGGGYSQTLYDAISRADASGHLFVAAAGNGGNDGVGDDNDVTSHYPSSYGDSAAVAKATDPDKPALENVVSVAATDSKDALASFSNYGSSSVDLAAPGVGILSTLPGNTYKSYSGTSMATPHVAGAAALLKSKDSNLDDAGLKARLLDYADKKTNLSDKMVTGSRLNAARVLGVPRVDRTTPTSGATGMALSFTPTVTFSEEMDRTTLETDPTTQTSPSVTLYQKYWYQVRKRLRSGKIRRVWTYRWVPVSATVSCNSPCTTATLDPRNPLVANTNHLAVVTTGAKDSEDTPLAENYSWTFTTGSA